MVMNSFGNRNFMQPMGRLSMHSKCLDFFVLKLFGAGAGWGRIFINSFVPDMFPSSSQRVPIKFLMCSPYLNWGDLFCFTLNSWGCLTSSTFLFFANEPI